MYLNFYLKDKHVSRLVETEMTADKAMFSVGRGWRFQYCDRLIGMKARIVRWFLATRRNALS